MGFFDKWRKKPKEIENKTFFKFFISEDGNNIDYNFEAHDLDKFLQMMSLLLSGSVSEEIINCIFKEIDDENIKESFISDILHNIENSLKAQGDRSVISSSEFNV